MSDLVTQISRPVSLEEMRLDDLSQKASLGDSAPEAILQWNNLYSYSSLFNVNLDLLVLNYCKHHFSKEKNFNYKPVDDSLRILDKARKIVSQIEPQWLTFEYLFLTDREDYPYQTVLDSVPNPGSQDDSDLEQFFTFTKADQNVITFKIDNIEKIGESVDLYYNLFLKPLPSDFLNNIILWSLSFGGVSFLTTLDNHFKIFSMYMNELMSWGSAISSSVKHWPTYWIVKFHPKSNVMFIDWAHLVGILTKPKSHDDIANGIRKLDGSNNFDVPDLWGSNSSFYSALELVCLSVLSSGTIPKPDELVPLSEFVYQFWRYSNKGTALGFRTIDHFLLDFEGDIVDVEKDSRIAKSALFAAIGPEQLFNQIIKVLRSEHPIDSTGHIKLGERGKKIRLIVNVQAAINIAIQYVYIMLGKPIEKWDYSTIGKGSLSDLLFNIKILYRISDETMVFSAMDISGHDSTITLESQILYLKVTKIVASEKLIGYPVVEEDVHMICDSLIRKITDHRGIPVRYPVKEGQKFLAHILTKGLVSGIGYTTGLGTAQNAGYIVYSSILQRSLVSSNPSTTYQKFAGDDTVYSVDTILNTSTVLATIILAALINVLGVEVNPLKNAINKGSGSFGFAEFLRREFGWYHDSTSGKSRFMMSSPFPRSIASLTQQSPLSAKPTTVDLLNRLTQTFETVVMRGGSELIFKKLYSVTLKAVLKSRGHRLSDLPLLAMPPLLGGFSVNVPLPKLFSVKKDVDDSISDAIPTIPGSSDSVESVYREQLIKHNRTVGIENLSRFSTLVAQNMLYGIKNSRLEGILNSFNDAKSLKLKIGHQINTSSTAVITIAENFKSWWVNLTGLWTNMPGYSALWDSVDNPSMLEELSEILYGVVNPRVPPTVVNLVQYSSLNRKDLRSFLAESGSINALSFYDRFSNLMPISVLRAFIGPGENLPLYSKPFNPCSGVLRGLMSTVWEDFMLEFVDKASVRLLRSLTLTDIFAASWVLRDTLPSNIAYVFGSLGGVPLYYRGTDKD